MNPEKLATIPNVTSQDACDRIRARAIESFRPRTVSAHMILSILAYKCYECGVATSDGLFESVAARIFLANNGIESTVVEGFITFFRGDQYIYHRYYWLTTPECNFDVNIAGFVRHLLDANHPMSMHHAKISHTRPTTIPRDESHVNADVILETTHALNDTYDGEVHSPMPKNSREILEGARWMLRSIQLNVSRAPPQSDHERIERDYDGNM